MEEGIEKNESTENSNRQEIFSKAIRAGKRTYFLDVKSTRSNDLYLTITESKKRFNRDGRFYYEKHKIFLYKEDFEKFTNGLKEVIDFIVNAKEEDYSNEQSEQKESTDDKKYTDVEFEDLEGVAAEKEDEEKE